MGRKRKSQVNVCVSNSNDSSNSSGNSLNGVQRTAANDRERTRMRVLSKAFVRLKTSLPWVPLDTKLSKLDTLKLASSYISYLTKILQDDENNSNIDDVEANESDYDPNICYGVTSNVSEFKYSSLLTNNSIDSTQSNQNFSANTNEKNKTIVEHFSASQNGANTTNRNGFVIFFILIC